MIYVILRNLDEQYHNDEIPGRWLGSRACDLFEWYLRREFDS